MPDSTLRNAPRSSMTARPHLPRCTMATKPSGAHFRNLGKYRSHATRTASSVARISWRGSNCTRTRSLLDRGAC
eukprot:7138311-Lingulodinium_polyedra.AAC.1